MFKKTRKKIVFVIMLILVSVWASILALIYASSYIDMYRTNTRLVERHAEMYVLNREDVLPPFDEIEPDVDNPDFEPFMPMFKLSTFYTIAFSKEGEVLELINNQPTLHSDEELLKLSETILSKNKEYGIKENLVYNKIEKDGYILITLMDNVYLNKTAHTIFRYTLIYGSIALIVFFFLSLFLSGKIVKPLEENYKKQKQFISDAGHELKTPVSIVNANAELLSREVGDNKWLNNILYENERMGNLIGQLLELTYTENVSLPMEKLDFSHLCNGEILPFESIIFENKLDLDYDIEDSIYVLGNEIQLKQLVSILLDNALRHSNENGHIKVNLTNEHNNSVLTVINEGLEIPSKHLKNIFERFYRIDTVRNEETKHYGLGLSIAKAITDSHKGKISVRCYDGLIEFKVVLPITK